MNQMKRELVRNHLVNHQIFGKKWYRLNGVTWFLFSFFKFVFSIKQKDLIHVVATPVLRKHILCRMCDVLLIIHDETLLMIVKLTISSLRRANIIRKRSFKKYKALHLLLLYDGDDHVRYRIFYFWIIFRFRANIDHDY